MYLVLYPQSEYQHNMIVYPGGSAPNKTEKSKEIHFVSAYVDDIATVYEIKRNKPNTRVYKLDSLVEISGINAEFTEFEKTIEKTGAV